MVATVGVLLALAALVPSCKAQVAVALVDQASCCQASPSSG